MAYGKGGRGRGRHGRDEGGPRRRESEMDRRMRFIKKAREKTTEALRSRDIMLVQLSKSVEELEKIANVMGEKLEELYGLYFPELKLQDKRSFASVVVVFDKESPDAKVLADVVGEPKAAEIAEKAKGSIGGELQPKDVEKIREMAREIKNVYSLIDAYEDYIEELSKEVCPNLQYLAGGKLAGKLVAAAGSLKKLSLMPASTVQVLGAEKALFKHLKSKGRIAPPKHGLIFQHPDVSQAPKAQRGKIARALAAKLSLAAKADAQTKRFIGPLLKESFEKRLEKIRSAKGKKK